MLGEVLLRRKAKTKKASVPLLADGERDVVVMGSLEIARHAESIGRAAPLFPRDAEKDIERWNDVADRIMHVGRAWVLRNILKSRDAQKEALPSFVPGIFAASSSMAVSFLVKKYAVPVDLDPEVRQVLRPALEEVREALKGKSYLLDGFTYADIAIAASLQSVRPHDAAPLGPATRAAWTNDELASEYDDLLMWRDAIVRKHR